jgi:hypothetical protein
MDQDHKTLLAILAVCTASTLDTVVKRQGAADDVLDAKQLAGALKLDMSHTGSRLQKGISGGCRRR